MTKKRLFSLGVGLVALMLGIFSEQVQTGIVIVSDVYKPYVLGVVGFVLVTVIPSWWDEKKQRSVSRGEHTL